MGIFLKCKVRIRTPVLRSHKQKRFSATCRDGFLYELKFKKYLILPGIYLLKVDKRNTITRWKIYSKLTNKDFKTTPMTPIVNFKHIWHFVLLFLLLTLNIVITGWDDCIRLTLFSCMCVVFWFLVLTLFPQFCELSRPYLVLVHISSRTKYYTPRSQLKKSFYCSNPYKFGITIWNYVFLIEILELPNFGHMTISAIQFESHNNFILVRSWIKIMMLKTFFNMHFLKKAWSRQFCWYYQNCYHVD